MNQLRKYEESIVVTAAILLAVFVLCFPIFKHEASFKNSNDLAVHYSVTSFCSNYQAPQSPERVNSFHITPHKILIDKYVYCPYEIRYNLLYDKNLSEIFKREKKPSILAKNCILRI